MSESSSTEERRLSVQSMSVNGVSLYLFIDDIGHMFIGIEDDEGSHDAYFDTTQQRRLRDWLNEVLP